MKSIVITVVFLFAAVLAACAAIEKDDPAIPVNANTYTTCPGLTAPDGSPLRCLNAINDPGAGGEECPLPGSGAHRCIELWPTAPDPMGKRVQDAGAPDAAPSPPVPTTASAPLVAPKEVTEVDHSGKG